MEVKFTKRIGSFILGSSRQWSERRLVRWVGEHEKVLIWSRYGEVWNGIVNSQPVLALICFQVVIIWFWWWWEHLTKIRKSTIWTRWSETKMSIFAMVDPLAWQCIWHQPFFYRSWWTVIRIQMKVTKEVESKMLVGKDSPVTVPAVVFIFVYLSICIWVGRSTTCHRACCGKPPTLGWSCTRWRGWNHRIDYIQIIVQFCDFWIKNT